MDASFVIPCYRSSVSVSNLGADFVFHLTDLPPLFSVLTGDSHKVRPGLMQVLVTVLVTRP